MPLLLPSDQHQAQILPQMPLNTDMDHKMLLIPLQHYALTRANAMPTQRRVDPKLPMDHTKPQTVDSLEMDITLYSIIQENKKDITLKIKSHQAS